MEEPPSLPLHHAEIFLDIEGIPDYETYYLVGMIVLVGDECTRYSFWADTEEEEKQMFPKAKKLIGREELQELGRRIKARKRELGAE